MSTPKSSMSERFTSKDKLVEAVEKLMTDDLWLPRLSSDRGGNKTLKNVSNAKLIRLHDTLTTVKEKFGSRAKLIDALLDVEKRAKDAGYRKRLEAHTVPRLYDQYRAAARRSK